MSRRHRAGRAAAELQPPTPEMFEPVRCYGCGAADAVPLATARDDFTGKPGRFSYVRCTRCGLGYQNPRLKLEHIAGYYDDDTVAERVEAGWRWLLPAYRWAVEGIERKRLAIVRRHLALDDGSAVLDVGCGAGRFLRVVRRTSGAAATGVDFKDRAAPSSPDGPEFRQGLFCEQDFAGRTFDLITMWHYLEHDYDPARSLARARELLGPGGVLVVEVPRLDSLTRWLFRDRWPGLQAPQHLTLFTRASLLALIRRAGFEVVEYRACGSLPAYFYFFTGVAFLWLGGRGLNLDRAILPYFVGQLLALPLRPLGRRLNLGIQTVVCRPRA
ncbi:Ubiquinone/menaquinone biosynthesis C-methylase UbiE [Tistlia consotensis]|uniref:Ubiquinone/menaquinone biosynthesis C-methylase UbiE n=1 Tax=Tistlia consotensis USBA 355 TaxID=560819 RepID=A0A1Y6CKQ2_9PROT|nr:class I SAM-dependent methyltransferase [Tistlia consotensis]SMF73494.1 Ubiquinone/menaquinone biosynthesis C-methylase UbiE [Tistlia consotensis USBA 355]SNS30230.1 Ubiquinone/menaquinone biosynthesis C-methylase UbiE [Tistlia consotensis]